MCTQFVCFFICFFFFVYVCFLLYIVHYICITEYGHQLRWAYIPSGMPAVQLRIIFSLSDREYTRNNVAQQSCATLLHNKVAQHCCATEVAQQLRSHETNCFATKIAEFYRFYRRPAASVVILLRIRRHKQKRRRHPSQSSGIPSQSAEEYLEPDLSQ